MSDLSPIPFKTKAVPDEDARLVHAACYDHEWCYVGWRHGEILMYQFKPRGLKMTNECQGFVDQHGFFWSRYQSARIAHRSGQIKDIPNTLMSEELWDGWGKPRPNGWEPD